MVAACEASEQAGKLQELMAEEPELSETETEQADVDAEFGYWLTPKELFARAYAQYTLERSGADDLLRLLLDHSYLTTTVSVQWQRDDFAPIAQALEQLFTLAEQKELIHQPKELGQGQWRLRSM